MKFKDKWKLLLPGIIVGLILGFTLTFVVGVDENNPIPNYIGGAMCCFIPTLLNCIIVLKGTAKHLDRKISFFAALKRTIPYAIVALVIGFMVVAFVVEQILGFNTCEISVLITAIYEAVLGVLVSTISAYIALNNYEDDVKYTRKNK
ncbi:MAG: hypothetical protein IJB71_02675 [Bacilli bacterium]|nr:hypothetical protein [Bacilli bacterium]